MSKRHAARWPCVALLSFLRVPQPATQQAKACVRCQIDGGGHEFLWRRSERVTSNKKCTSCSRRPQQGCPVNKENRNALPRRRLHVPQLRSRRLRGIYIRPLVLAAHYSHWRLVSAP